jgi:hypothetical protein
MNTKADHYIRWSKENKSVVKNNIIAKKVLRLMTSNGKDKTVIVRFSEIPSWEMDLFSKLGKFFPIKGRLHKKMQLNNCHENSKKLLFSNKIDSVATGFALSNDGLWRSHSWGLKEGKIFETTQPFICYFGYDMKDVIKYQKGKV